MRGRPRKDLETLDEREARVLRVAYSCIRNDTSISIGALCERTGVSDAAAIVRRRGHGWILEREGLTRL